MGAALSPYLPPPPPGSGPPSRWGDEQELATLLAVESTETRTLTIEADADFLIATAGHVLAERERLEAEGRWQDLRRDVEGLLPNGQAEVALEYLLARTLKEG
jgi:hypothetical protein